MESCYTIITEYKVKHEYDAHEYHIRALFYLQCITMMWTLQILPSFSSFDSSLVMVLRVEPNICEKSS